MSEESYGTVTVGYGSNVERELKVTNFLKGRYKDDRLVTISELEDGSFVLLVENPASSDRNPQSIMRLSKESFMGLLSTSFLYFTAKGEDLTVEMKKAADDRSISYSLSDNLTHPGNEA